MSKPSISNVTDLLDAALAYRYFEPDTATEGKVAIPCLRVPGEGKLVVALGENASGKSFFRRLTKSTCSKSQVECIDLSMSGSTNRYGGMAGMIYGDEARESTGVNSSRTVSTGIRTCEGRTTPHVIFWDEPDLGLSDGWAAGMGVKLREFALAPPEHTIAAIIVTHSKALVRALVAAKPHVLFFGESPPPSLAVWLKAKPKVRDLDALYDETRNRYKLIQSILNTIPGAD